MGGKDLKRIEKLLRFPPDFSFKDLEKILEFFGFRKKEGTRGSHNIFILVKPRKDVHYETDQITVPTIKGRKVKKEYLKMIAKYLHLEEWYERNKK